MCEALQGKLGLELLNLALLHGGGVVARPGVGIAGDCLNQRPGTFPGSGRRPKRIFQGHAHLAGLHESLRKLTHAVAGGHVFHRRGYGGEGGQGKDDGEVLVVGHFNSHVKEVTT